MPARCRFAYARGGQQRAFDLHKVHVIFALDAGAGHGTAHRVAGFHDLFQAADFFRFEVAGKGDASRQARQAVIGVLLAAVDFKYQPVRAQTALGATGHDKGNTLLNLGFRQGQLLGKETAQGAGRKGAGKVVHAAIAFGLAEHGNDAGRVDLAVADGLGQGRDVVWRAGAQTGDARFHGQYLFKGAGQIGPVKWVRRVRN